MATLAVFLVLGGGTALAAYVVSSNSQIGPNTVSGHKPPAGKHANIIAGSIASGDLAPAARGARAYARVSSGGFPARSKNVASVTHPVRPGSTTSRRKCASPRPAPCWSCRRRPSPAEPTPAQTTSRTPSGSSPAAGIPHGYVGRSHLPLRRFRPHLFRRVFRLRGSLAARYCAGDVAGERGDR